MNNLMSFEGTNVEVFKLNDTVYFNPYHVGKCLELCDSAIRMAITKMNKNQVIKLTNSDVKNIDFRKLNNAGESFLTESGVYKLILKSNKPKAEEFSNWVTDEVIPSIRKTGTYTLKQPEQMKLPDTTYEYKTKYYKGQIVITFLDLEYFTKIERIHFNQCLLRHKNNFTEGVDYWFLEGPELAKFKTDNKLSRYIGSLVIISERGFLKFSKLMQGVPKELKCFNVENYPKLGQMKRSVTDIPDNPKFQNRFKKIDERLKAVHSVMDLMDSYNSVHETEAYKETILSLAAELYVQVCNLLKIKYSVVERDL